MLLQGFNLATADTNQFDAFVIQNRHALENASSHEDLAKIAESVRCFLPDDLLDQIDAYKGGQSDFLYLEGSRVIEEGFDIPATPAGNVCTPDMGPLLYRAALGLVNGLVNTAPLRDCKGRVEFNHVIPQARHAKYQVHSTDKPLAFHIDGMRRQRVPGSIGLYCVRPQETAETYFVSVARILKSLDRKIIEALQQQEYSFDDPELVTGAAFGTKHGECIKLPYAILSSDKKTFRYSQRSVGLSDCAVAALSELREAIDAVEREIVSLNTGDILLFRNNHLLHGRSCYPFLDNPDERRWVIRQTSDHNGPETGF